MRHTWIAATIAALLLHGTAGAEWTGGAEAGFTKATGNTETTNLYGKVELEDELVKWRHKVRADALYNEEDGDTTAERYIAAWESDRKLTEREWVFGAARYQKDRFSSIEEQLSITGGYGRRFIKSERQSFESTFGAGYKWFEEQDSDERDSEAILRYTGDYKLKTTANSDFRQQLLIESGESNTFVESITAFTASINKRLATRISYNVQHNTDVPDDTEKTDTITAVTLVYNIGG